MSLEECKRLAEERQKRRQESRRSTGMVDGEEVNVVLSRNSLNWPHSRLTVFFFAYGEVSTKDFKKKVLAERYFEELAQKYGLKEAEG